MNLRHQIIRIAHDLPVGSAERRALLRVLSSRYQTRADFSLLARTLWVQVSGNKSESVDSVLKMNIQAKATLAKALGLLKPVGLVQEHSYTAHVYEARGGHLVVRVGADLQWRSSPDPEAAREALAPISQQVHEYNVEA